MRDRRNARLAEVAAARLGHVAVALEPVWHRHNASAVLRTADALGVHHVHLVGEPRFEPSRGPSKGAGRWLALHRHDTPADAIAAIREAGMALWVADLPDEDTPVVPPSAVPVGRPLCLWLGAELQGVCAEARAAADGVVTLPMRGMSQSLNVGVAGAMILHELVRRSVATHGDGALLPAEGRAALLANWIAREDAAIDAEAARQAALEALGEVLQWTVREP